MGNPFDADPILVEVVRNGYVESVHRGRVAITAPDGRLTSSVGRGVRADVSAERAEAAAGRRHAAGRVSILIARTAGAGLRLALREPIHLDGVREILALGELDESVLQTPPDWPLDEAARETAIRERSAQVVDRDELLGQARRR